MRNRILVLSLWAAIAAMQDGMAAESSSLQEEGAQQEDTQSKAGEAPLTLDQVVVTGSRVARQVQAGHEAPTPVTILDASELFLTTPSSISDALNKLPAMQGSLSPATSGAVQANAVRGNYLNLRGLGPARTLIMQDGRRVAPSGNNGATDTDLIPQMLLRQVDVVTGGASAAYGSDAVSGVVNFITDTEFTGLKTLSQVGIAGEGDNESYRFGVAGGVELVDGRLNLIGSVERSHSAGIERRTDRHRSSEYWIRGGSGTAAVPYDLYDNATYNYMTSGGYIASGPLAGRQFVAGGDTIEFDRGTPIPGMSGVNQNSEGVGHSPDCCTLVPELTSNQFFGRATFEITPQVSAFGQVSYAESVSKEAGILFSRHLNQLLLHRDNAFLSEATRTALGDTETFVVSRSFDEWGPNASRMESRGLNAAFGLEGLFGDGWRWDLSYVKGDTKFQSRTHTQTYQRLYASFDAVFDANGNIVCNITLTNPGVLDDCMPLNILGANSASLDVRDWLMADSIWTTRNKMDYVAFNIAGDILELPAGPLSLASGVEYRKLSMRQTTNSDPAVPLDRTGLRLAPPSIARFYQPNVGPVNGSYSVREAYAELNVPLLKDVAFADYLEFNGAYRLTDYSTSGDVGTWKAGFAYQPGMGIRLRGSVSRDIRAPSLTELFSGQNQVGSALNDPLTGFNGAVLVLSGGNPDLEPEEGTTHTVGISIEPSSLPGFVLAIDYYSIEVDSAIAAPYTAQQVLDLCFQSGGTSPLCNQIERDLGPANPDPANFPRRIHLTNQNVSLQEISGFDIESSYRRDIGTGRLTLRALATHLREFRQQRAAGTPVQEFAGSADDFTTPLPKWRGLVEVGYDTGTWRINLQEQVIGSLNRSNSAVWVDNELPTVLYTNLGAGYVVQRGMGSMEFFLTINNLFDKEGPLHPGTVPGLAIPTLRTLYDINGRNFTVGFKADF